MILFLFIPSFALFLYNLSHLLTLISIIPEILVLLLIIIRINEKKLKLPEKKSIKIREIILLLLGVLFLLIGSFLLVPVVLRVNGTATNIYAHFIGLVLGFFIYLFK